MPKAQKNSAEPKKPFDPEIDRLIYIGTVVQSLVNRSSPLLATGEFPKSSDAMAKLSKTFDRELEVNLLRAYKEGEPPRS